MQDQFVPARQKKGTSLTGKPRYHIHSSPRSSPDVWTTPQLCYIRSTPAHIRYRLQGHWHGMAWHGTVPFPAYASLFTTSEKRVIKGRTMWRSHIQSLRQGTPTASQVRRCLLCGEVGRLETAMCSLRNCSPRFSGPGRSSVPCTRTRGFLTVGVWKVFCFDFSCMLVCKRRLGLSVWQISSISTTNRDHWRPNPVAIGWKRGAIIAGFASSSGTDTEFRFGS